ncbi:response regulator transcription factor [Actinoplanes sp. NPDC051859]|uniref:response regulator transcription factor n=1 Tax=Actinoplanes sp. NPDC051859 TaxID=3363909 RepID=UPI003791ACBC
MRVLVIEDDVQLGGAVCAGLRRAGFAVDWSVNLADGDLKADVNRYDCLVVDRSLPDGDGVRLVAQRRRAGMRTPVLVTTPHNRVVDRIEGFEQGADDCLAKPFAVVELAARVRALCRRGESPRPPTIDVDDLSIDLAGRRVFRAGQPLTLSAKEFCVLELLAARTGEVVGRADLIESCWDEMAEPESNVVDAVMARLRRRLGAPSLITTQRGVGFRLAAVGA